MSDWLYLAPNGRECAWWGAAGELAQGDLAQAAVALAQRPVHLLLPMEWASYHLVQLPPRSGRWLRQALASALEEQLVDDVAQLHLALAPLQAQQASGVLAIKRQLLTDCLNQLQGLGLQPKRVHLDADCLGQQQPRALFCQGRWLLGGSAPLRLALTVDELHDLQPLLPDDLHWQGEPPASLPAGSRQHWQALAQPWLQLSQGAAQAIDLRQAEFALRAPRKSLWHLSAAILIAAGSAQCLQYLALDTYINQQTEQLQQATAQLWQQRFSESMDNLDLAALIEAKQQNLLQPSGIALRLSQLAQQWSSSHGALARVQRLDYQPDEGWSLQVSAPAFADLQLLREGLLAQGLDISIESSVRAADGVSARFQIKE
ncbi:type II secretion system protein GspL [Pseudomonas sp. 5P_3.1_Bac2]|uniref:type II secretion system protein GspL n=1 Tax=Pseudomonas sp. 5P_3.1_Bac2 TaxID=2971617 RepID=UPI0021C6BA6C|nr:type II secretion system protein GspL [Pseudomonas sp. 5P_3.1_Bac2]MCU1717741.1 type II secretion system protein GspL [Pseudomonas sp. 5P_3.1_Bac2]